MFAMKLGKFGSECIHQNFKMPEPMIVLRVWKREKKVYVCEWNEIRRQTFGGSGAAFYCSSVKHKHGRNMGEWLFAFHTYSTFSGQGTLTQCSKIV